MSPPGSDREGSRQVRPAGSRQRSSTIVHAGPGGITATAPVADNNNKASDSKPQSSALSDHGQRRQKNGGYGFKTPVHHQGGGAHAHTVSTGYERSREYALGHGGGHDQPHNPKTGHGLHPRTSSQATSTKAIAPLSDSHYQQDIPEGLFNDNGARQAILSLYTYTPSVTQQTATAPAPSLLPAPAPNLSSSRVQLSYASLPWPVKQGDYLEIRRVQSAHLPARPGPSPVVLAKKNDRPSDGDALEGVKPNKGRDGYIFQVREDMPSVPLNQIQVPNAVATAFKLQHRQDVEVFKISDPEKAYIDFIELQFSQYVGRADMWRLGMSLENTTVHVGEKISLAGGAVRADVQGIWRRGHRYSSGIVTSKTKTIFRSKSAQTYIFIQMCRETYEFDEDGEQYYEKIIHGFLPELFQKWTTIGASHLVTLVLFGRAFYEEDDVRYMEKNDLTMGLMKDCRGRWCKDFYRVVMDFERRTDWLTALPMVKKRIHQMEREIFLDFNLAQMAGTEHADEQKLVIGMWSYAFEGPILEAINLALNPFDEHYIDRDLSRTGLSLIVLTPGTGHFAVDKNLLRLTTERMIDHGIALDLVCMTKMPLHSVPLFSYMSERPKRAADESDGRAKPSTPDPLYFDAPVASDRELTECYSLAFWVFCSYYSKTHDKPFRRDRFVPRCKMYEIQMLGILDHNLTTVIVPLLDSDEMHAHKRRSRPDERSLMREEHDAALFSGSKRHETAPWNKETLSPPSTNRSGVSSSLGTSYQSSKLHHVEDKSRVSTPGRPSGSRESNSRERHYLREPRDGKTTTRLSPAVEESFPQSSLPDTDDQLDSPDMPDMPVAQRHATAVPVPTPGKQQLDNRRPSTTEQTPKSRIVSMTSTINASPAQSVVSLPSGASTPRTASRRLKNQSSRGSFASRFASTWLFGPFGTRASPSVATAANETVERQDVSTTFGGASQASSPAPKKAPLPAAASPHLKVSGPQPVPGRRGGLAEAAPISPAKPKPVPTQPLPILSQAGRVYDEEAAVARSMPRSIPRSIPRSLHNSSNRMGRSLDDSWRNKSNAAFGRTGQHRTINPCDPREGNRDMTLEGGHGRRWQHVRPRINAAKLHVVKWRSLSAPACLPLTTDFMPTRDEIATYYEAHSYDIACFPDQVSFLIRPDAAQINLPLAVMREMASQRLSQNFQFIVLPHNTVITDDLHPVTGYPTKNLLMGNSTSAGLRVGGASDVLKDANGAIYLSWSNHIHRLTFDPEKQSVTVQRFVRKIRHSTKPHAYKCLVWPYEHTGFEEASALFRYPNIDAKLNFNYLDRLIAGEEENLRPNLRFWRARYLLIPSGREPSSVAGLMPRGTQGEEYNTSEILITGAVKVLELMSKHQWKKPGVAPTPLRLLATTFDPSTCVLDEGLMLELERLTSGKEKFDSGQTLEGMTLQAVADTMNKPNNGLIIRDRWWNCEIDSAKCKTSADAQVNMHEDSFTGEQFTQWLMVTFADVQTREQAVEWGQSLFEKGLIEHVTGVHAFHDTLFFYRLNPQYDKEAKPRPSKSWFSKTPVRPVALEHSAEKAGPGTSPVARASLKITDKPSKKKKVKMSQSIVVDLDPQRKSDRAEVAMLHADIIHNSRNAFHFELNWLGVTAGLLEDLRLKCSTLAERYGLRFVEAPVEQIKDVGHKSAFRTPLRIPLALAPPVIPDLHLRLAETTGPGQCAQFFEYAILTQKFGFVLDLEASDRYPETIDAEYAYRSKARFEYSQFVHRSGLALVQCVGREEGFLWVNNRPFISAPTRGRQQSVESWQGITPMASKQEQARALREEFIAFCSDKDALAKFYEEVTPPMPAPVSPLASAVIDLSPRHGDITPPDAWAGA